VITIPSHVPIVGAIVLLLAAIAARDAAAHPWHRHRDDAAAAGDRAAPVEHAAGMPPAESILSAESILPDEAMAASHAGGDPARDVAGAWPPRGPFRLTAAPRKAPAGAADIAAAFGPFAKLGAVTTRRDDRWLYVESQGVPDHPLMVGIRNWQQQVPLPQNYSGVNAWQIPLEPVPAREPASTRNRFLRGAIALAVNGIPIFNPLNNRGEDALAIGELDDYGGHCGRADDYHYHVAPIHLEKVVGKGQPIAYALDGYAVYGSTEPDGAPMEPLDKLGGHEDGVGGYHYHAMTEYPYLIGGFRGEVVERDGQVDPQPRAQPVREALPPLRGATIVDFDAPADDTRKLTYEVDGRKGFVEYTVAKDGSTRFTFTDTAGKSTTQSYSPRRRGPGGGGQGGGPPGEAGGRQDRPGGGPGGGPRPGESAPPRPARPPRPGERQMPKDGPPGGAHPGAAPSRPGGRGPATSAARGAGLTVTSPAFGPEEDLPVEFTCDGAGVSPPLEWQPGPEGTKSYAVTVWHEAPDMVKSYWLVYGIPAGVTRLPKDARGVGTTGLNDKRRAEYDPMCSKGPGRKTYHVTVYALSATPALPAGGANRDALLAAIRDTVLAEGTLSFAYERGAGR
jgi:phosphatidylethanolamine-binding protein (PEBP) family uncharacterized protein